MPFIDLPHHRRRKGPHGLPFHVLEWFEDRKRMGRRRRDLDESGVPVEPNKPKNLSGGAAAALEFDDEAQT